MGRPLDYWFLFFLFYDLRVVDKTMTFWHESAFAKATSDRLY